MRRRVRHVGFLRFAAPPEYPGKDRQPHPPLIVGAHPLQVDPYPFEWEHFPGVAMGYSYRVPPLNRVTLNHFQALEEAIARLAALRYERIAVGLGSMWALTHKYFAAFEVYQRSIPKTRRIPPFFISRYTVDARVFGRKMPKLQPDAFIDASGGHFAKALANLGIRFPDDMAYATLNWHAGMPELAGINQNSHRIGAKAVDLLINQINLNEKGLPDIQTFTLICGSWVDGPFAPPRNRP